MTNTNKMRNHYGEKMETTAEITVTPKEFDITEEVMYISYSDLVMNIGSLYKEIFKDVLGVKLDIINTNGVPLVYATFKFVAGYNNGRGGIPAISTKAVETNRQMWVRTSTSTATVNLTEGAKDIFSKYLGNRVPWNSICHQVVDRGVNPPMISMEVRNIPLTPLSGKGIISEIFGDNIDGVQYEYFIKLEPRTAMRPRNERMFQIYRGSSDKLEQLEQAINPMPVQQIRTDDFITF